MENKSLQQQIAEMRQSFLDEGIVDEQYVLLEGLADEDNPDFVEEVFGLFFRDSTKLIATLEQAIEQTPPEIAQVDKCLHKLRGSSGSVGAAKVYKEVGKARELWQAGNLDGAKAAVQEMKSQHSLLRAKLETYFQMLRQAGPADPAVNSKW